MRDNSDACGGLEHRLQRASLKDAKRKIRLRSVQRSQRQRVCTT